MRINSLWFLSDESSVGRVAEVLLAFLKVSKSQVLANQHHHIWHITAKDIERFSLMFNPKFEKALFVGPNKNKGFEFGYAGGPYYRWLRSLSPGLEF